MMPTDSRHASDHGRTPRWRGFPLPAHGGRRRTPLFVLYLISDQAIRLDAFVREAHMLLPTANAHVSGRISAVSVFEKLVQKGEVESLITLPVLHHSFLVGCLVEHLDDVAIFHDSVALNLLNAAMERREEGDRLLMRAGDEALLLAGLYPDTARKLNVSPTYFRLLGQAAYASLAARYPGVGRGEFFDDLARHFQVLERVLKAMRMPPNESYRKAEKMWEAACEEFLRFNTGLKLQ